MRKSLVLAAVTAATLLAASCKDAVSPRSAALNPYGATANVTLSDAIDAMVADFFPTGLETATGTRWATIKTKLAAGDAATARKMLVELTKFIQQKTGDISAPSGETRAHAATRLILAMATYVYGGPGSPLPGVGPDATVQIVPAGQAATVKAPSFHAAIGVPAGATSEDRIFAVVQNATPFDALCSGPLPTQRCQYPLFYKLESFPDVKTNIPLRVAVCMRTTGDRRPIEYPDQEPGGPVHQRMALAHQRPANDADKTDGSYVEGGIEVLPRVPDNQQSGIVSCADAAFLPQDGWRGMGERAVHALASAAKWVLTPKNAYAYDQGEEHTASFLSDFNGVDRFSSANLEVANVSAPADAMVGSSIAVAFDVRNVSRRNGGSATGASSPTTAAAYLSTDDVLGDDLLIGRVDVPALPPDGSVHVAFTNYALPSTPGTYHVIYRVEPDAKIAEVSVTDNQTSTPLAITVAPTPGQDVVVFNDINFFGSPAGSTIDPTADVNNQQLYQNLVGYTATGPRASQTGVMIHAGQGSVAQTVLIGGLGYIQKFIDYYNNHGSPVTVISDQSTPLGAIPSNIKVLFLVLPGTPYTNAQINILKQFAADGGRIVFIGENTMAYSSTLINDVENAFFQKMGAQLTNTGAQIDCGFHVLPATSLRTHQITTSMTGVTMGCASIINLGPNDYGLIAGTDGVTFIAGVAKIDVTPLPTTPVLVALQAAAPSSAAVSSDIDLAVGQPQP